MPRVCAVLGKLVAIWLAVVLALGCAAPQQTGAKRVATPMGHHRERSTSTPVEARESEPPAASLPDSDPDSAVAINERALARLGVATQGSATDQAGATATEPAAVSPMSLELAIRIAERGLELYPDDARLHNTAGLIQVESRRFSEALSHFERARRINDDFEQAHFNYAALALRLRNYHAAIDGYSQVLRLEPKSYEARLGLASALAASAGLDAAHRVLGLLREARDLAPTRPEAYFNAALFMDEVCLRAANPGGSWAKRLRQATCLYASFTVRADPRVHAEKLRLARERRANLGDNISIKQRERRADTTEAQAPFVDRTADETCERIGVDGFEP